MNIHSIEVSIDSGPIQAWYTEHSGVEFDRFSENREYHEFTIDLTGMPRPLEIMTCRVLTAAGRYLGISVKGNRLFGNPPLNPTYFCLWEIEIDGITGYLDKGLINGLKRAMRTFKFNFADMENAPLWLYMPPTDPDGKFTCIGRKYARQLTRRALVTILKLSIDSVTVTMPIDIYALQLCAESVSLTTNDLASSEYAKVLSLAIPCLVGRVIRRSDGTAASGDDWNRIAYLRTAVFLGRHVAPANWKQARLKQQRFVRSQDQQSRRCGSFYGQDVPAGEQTCEFESASTQLIPRVR